MSTKKRASRAQLKNKRAKSAHKNKTNAQRVHKEFQLNFSENDFVVTGPSLILRKDLDEINVVIKELRKEEERKEEHQPLESPLKLKITELMKKMDENLKEEYKKEVEREEGYPPTNLLKAIITELKNLRKEFEKVSELVETKNDFDLDKIELKKTDEPIIFEDLRRRDDWEVRSLLTTLKNEFNLSFEKLEIRIKLMENEFKEKLETFQTVETINNKWKVDGDRGGALVEEKQIREEENIKEIKEKEREGASSAPVSDHKRKTIFNQNFPNDPKATEPSTIQKSRLEKINYVIREMRSVEEVEEQHQNLQGAFKSKIKELIEELEKVVREELNKEKEVNEVETMVSLHSHSNLMIKRKMR